MIELNRRATINLNEKNKNSYIDMIAADAEIAVEDEEHQVYLHMQWNSENPDEVYFNATGRSVYDFYDEANKNRGWLPDERIAERDEIKAAGIPNYFEEDIVDHFRVQFAALTDMLGEILSEYDVDCFLNENLEEEYDLL